MLEKINRELTKLESKHEVTILFACETGSRAWGFPSPDSDFDVRMIYMHEPEWYLTLSEPKDVIEYMSDDRELDITGWDIKKCLKLLQKSNASLLERVQSPIVYQEAPGFVSGLLEMAVLLYSPIATMHHYLGLAKKSFLDIEQEESVKLKRLFYALRASMACKWIMDKDDVMPPIEFTKMVNELKIEEGLRRRINELIALKAGKNEDYMHAKEEGINQFIREQIDIAESNAEKLPSSKAKASNLDNYFRNVLKTHGK